MENNTGCRFETMAVIGVGLIGASLAIAARRAGVVNRVVGVGRGRENLDLASRLGIVDAFTQKAAEGVRDADLVVLATPVMTYEALLSEITAELRPDAIVTDVGSIKGRVVEQAERLLSDPARFIGAHPIAGTEHSGAGAAFPELFEGALCILTPTERSDAEVVEKVGALWRAVGSKVITLQVSDHDRILAAVSHLPHIVAYALIATIEEIDTDEQGRVLQYSAGGLTDFTRIAASSPEMWRDICLSNWESIKKALGTYRSALDRIEAMVEAGRAEELDALFARAKVVRDRIRPGAGHLNKGAMK